jgi:hypothetical protein
MTTSQHRQPAVHSGGGNAESQPAAPSTPTSCTRRYAARSLALHRRLPPWQGAAAAAAAANDETQQTPPKQRRGEPTIHRAVPYSPAGDLAPASPRCVVDVYVPPGLAPGAAEAAPVVLFCHGGVWAAGAAWLLGLVHEVIESLRLCRCSRASPRPLLCRGELALLTDGLHPGAPGGHRGRHAGYTLQQAAGHAICHQYLVCPSAAQTSCRCLLNPSSTWSPPPSLPQNSTPFTPTPWCRPWSTKWGTR